MFEPWQGVYSLAVFRMLFRDEKTQRITMAAQDGAAELQFSTEDIAAVVEMLSDRDYRATLPSYNFEGTSQDVYWPTYKGIRLYVKVQIHDGKAVVISFKKNTSS